MFREMVTFLSEDGWPVAPDTFDGLPCIRTRFIGNDEAWDCRVRPYDPFGQLAFESILPVTVPDEYFDAMTQLVVRTNWRLLTGAFQLDLDTGELRLPDDAVPPRRRGIVRGTLPGVGLQQCADGRSLPGPIPRRSRRRGRHGGVRAIGNLSRPAPAVRPAAWPHR